jgi:hypothetical protein
MSGKFILWSKSFLPIIFLSSFVFVYGEGSKTDIFGANISPAKQASMGANKAELQHTRPKQTQSPGVCPASFFLSLSLVLPAPKVSYNPQPPTAPPFASCSALLVVIIGGFGCPLIS